jgi:hypothetical protein
MKVYFTASLSGKTKYEREYSLIIDILKENGLQVVEHILNTSKELTKKETRPEKIKIFHTLSNMLKSADLVVAEISYPSVNVGREIALALDSNKYVIVLHLAKISVGLLEGDSNEKLKVCPYSTKNLKDVIEQALKEIQEHTDVRFNFFISPSIVEYFDWLSKKRRIPRSVYLRNLLEKQIKEDAEYQEEKIFIEK